MQYVYTVYIEYNIPFIDMRALLLSAIPWYWVLYMGYISIDGEHPNERATRLLADAFSMTISPHLQTMQW